METYPERAWVVPPFLTFGSWMCGPVGFVGMRCGRALIQALLRRCFVAVALLGVVVTGSRSAKADDVQITDEARRHFAAGVALLKDPGSPRYEEAYSEFKAAYAASPSYKILGNLGLSAMKIERDTEAIKAYTEYLRAAGPDLTPAESNQVRQDLLTLTEGLTRVTVFSDPPGAIIRDVRTPGKGSEVRNSYDSALNPIELGIRRGQHLITATLPGFQEARWEFEARGGMLPAHLFKLIPIPRQREAVSTIRVRAPIPAATYVTGALALGFVVAGSAFGALALSEHSSYERVNNGANQAQAADDRNKGQVYNVLTDSFFGAAIVSAAVTTYLIAARPLVERQVTGKVRVSPGFSAHGPSIAASMSF